MRAATVRETRRAAPRFDLLWPVCGPGPHSGAVVQWCSGPGAAPPLCGPPQSRVPRACLSAPLSTPLQSTYRLCLRLYTHCDQVLTRVIGHYPAANMLLVDMGWTGTSAQGKEHGYVTDS